MAGSFTAQMRGINVVLMRALVLLVTCLTPYSIIAAPDYLDYYQRIAKAEEAVVNGQYPEALYQYQASFSQYPYSNPIDCYVAAQVASYTGDTASCAELLRRGISFGLPVKTILGNPHIASYINGRERCSLSQPTIDSCWNIYRRRINKEARSSTISLIQRDQSVVLNTQNGEIYTKGSLTLKPIYQPLWDSLLREIISLTKSSGFPAQKIIGTMNGDDGLFAVGPNTVFVYYILIHHGNAWPQIGELLWAELLKGNITPQMYGAIADNSSGERGNIESARYLAVRPCDNKACKKFLSAHLEKINLNRSKIGLCSYEVMEKKHAGSQEYRRWKQKGAANKMPVFDFQTELHFMGLANQ